MRTESPEFIQVNFDKSKVQTDVPLTHIVWQRDWPSDGQRQPGILYLPDMECTERDEALGRFIASWNRVERQIDFLISAYLKTDIAIASAIYDIGLNIQQTTNLLDTAASNVLSKMESTALSRWLRRYKELNTKRNRIIHGDWICHIDLGTDAEGLIIILHCYWLRKYDPPNKQDRDKLQQEHEQVKSKYLFSIERIINLCGQAKTLEDDARKLPRGSDEK